MKIKPVCSHIYVYYVTTHSQASSSIEHKIKENSYMCVV